MAHRLVATAPNTVEIEEFTPSAPGPHGTVRAMLGDEGPATMIKYGVRF